MSIFQITWNETFKSLLASSIPELKPDHFTRYGNIFRYEINTYGRLYKIKDTFLVGSN